jgi:hypothetical protein
MAVKEDIAYLPAENFGSVIYPEGRSRASSIAAGIMRELDPIPYGVPTTVTKGVYGRVLERFPSPTARGRELAHVLTMKEPKQEAGEHDAFTFLIEVDKLTFLQEDVEEKEILEPEVVLIDELMKAAEKKEAELPPPSKPKTRLELYNEMLDSTVPDRYDWQRNELIIHYPSVTLSRNGTGKTHTIYDMYLKLSFNDDLSVFTDVVKGRRTTLSEAEVLKGYQHSHLASHYNPKGWNNFCFGNTPLAELMLSFFDGIDVDKFLVLLFWLEDYLGWESAEGGPYQSFLEVGKGLAQATARRLPSATPDSLGMLRMAQQILPKLTSEDIEYRRNIDGTGRWVLVIRDVYQWCQFISSFYIGGKVFFDKVSGNFISAGLFEGNRDLQIRKEEWLIARDRVSFKGKAVDYKVIEREKDEVKQDLIEIAPPIIIAAATRCINNLLNRPIEAYDMPPGLFKS